MQTYMNDTTWPTPAPTKPAKPKAVDIETRLTLASAGMDALMAHRHGDALAEAQDAVQAAQAEAEQLDPEPVTFRSSPVLKAAGELIRVRGWHRGSWESPEGRICAQRAIEMAAGGNPRSVGYQDAIIEMLNRIASDTGNVAVSVSGWNDRQDSPEEVLRLLY